MIRLWARSFAAFVALFSVVTFSSRALFAASHDAEAVKLREAAIYQDYLATDFSSAEKKLTQALTLCEKPADCTATTRARLHCDLGVVFFASQKADDGRAQFAAALQEDPNVALDPDLSSPELQKEFAAVKGGGAAASSASSPAGPAPPPAASGAGPGAGEPSDAGVAGPANTGENEGEAVAAPAKATANPAKASANANATSESDCPPGFPGCTAAETTCSTDDDCNNGEKCVNEVCRSEKEQTETAPGKNNWVSLAFQLDLPLLPAKHDVCLGGQGYSCFNTNGTWYDGTPLQNGGGEIQSSGLQVGTKRVLLGFDRVFFDHFTLGGAVGFAFGGGPTRQGGSPFFPLQLEARGKYWFGHRPLGHKGFRFYVMLNGGMSEVAASIQTFVYETATTPIPKEAWFHMGRGFVGLGAGPMYAITPNMGVFLELRAMQMFPTAGQNFAGQLGYGVGF